MRKSKWFALVLFIFLLYISFHYFVNEPHISFIDQPLQDQSNTNLLCDISHYLHDSKNAFVSHEIISTGMITGDNYENFYAIFKIPPEDETLSMAWDKGNPSIAFESKLQNTSEWFKNNQYRISLYYYADDKQTQQIMLFDATWVGHNHRVSSIQALPLAAKGKPIFIKYQSALANLLSINNGNDVRFQDNYLTIQ